MPGAVHDFSDVVGDQVLIHHPSEKDFEADHFTGQCGGFLVMLEPVVKEVKDVIAGNLLPLGQRQAFTKLRQLSQVRSVRGYRVFGKPAFNRGVG